MSSGTWTSRVYYDNDQLMKSWRSAVIQLVDEAHREGLLSYTSILARARGEVAFCRKLENHLSRTQIRRDTVIVANSELYAWAFRKAHTPAIVLVAHGPMYPTLRSRRPIAAITFRKLVEPAAIDLVRVLVAIDDETATYFARNYPQTIVRKIPLAIDLTKFSQSLILQKHLQEICSCLSWPRALLAFDLSPSRLRIAALAGMACLGLALGLFGPDIGPGDARFVPTLVSSETNLTAMFEPEPLTGVTP